VLWSCKDFPKPIEVNSMSHARAFLDQSCEIARLLDHRFLDQRDGLTLEQRLRRKKRRARLGRKDPRLDQRMRLEDAAAGLIWCPSSNLRLFGRTAEVSELVRRGRVALGTDSRFSGSRDLLCELRAARENSALDAGALESLVTRDAAALLRLADRGALKIGARADLLILPEGMALSNASRADVRLVMLGGRALYADADYARLVAPTAHWAPVRVDGKPKMLERRLVAALAAAAVGEPGLEISDLTWAAA